MIKKGIVRKARMTGYQKRLRRLKGNIFLKKEWIGRKVIVIPIVEFRKLERLLRQRLTKLKHIGRLSK